MSPLRRRGFLVAGSAAAFAGPGNAIDDTLRAGIARRRIPAAVGMFASKDSVLYSGAFGRRNSAGPPVALDTIFNVASMTKAITTAAVLQLVEQGKAALDEPVSRHLRQFQNVEVLDGFDPSGKPRLRPAVKPVTLRHLLTHTSGLCYDLWDGSMFRYNSTRPAADPGRAGPLMFEPGERWQYGQGIDWAGRLVETLSGLSLEEYFQQKIFRPLGMEDTSYILPAAKFDRLISSYTRNDNGELQQNERKFPDPPKSFNGGGGLFSTAGDYTRFLQMILNRGKGPGKVAILNPKTVDAMKQNQIGQLTAGKMKSFRPNLSSDVDIQPGQTEKWSLGFLVNTTAYPGGRAAGGLAWAGFYNTYYWVDPKRNRCGVLLMQYLPFADKEAIGLLDEFERASYAARLG